MKYEKFNGKLYIELDEAAIMLKIENAYATIMPYIEGVKTCDNNIEAYELQKKKYLTEIDSVLSGTGLDKDIIKQLSPQKATEMGF